MGGDSFGWCLGHFILDVLTSIILNQKNKALLYDRTETQDEIVIVYKYQPLWYIIYLGFLASIPFTRPDQDISVLMGTLFLILAFIQVGGKAKPNKEIKQAMQSGKIQVSGSKFSFRNPLTFTIKKSSSNS